MADISPEVRRLFEKDSQALWREALGLLVRLGDEGSARAGTDATKEPRNLVRRFLHAIHSLKGLLVMLPETVPLAERLQAVEAHLSFRAPSELVSDFRNWGPVARFALESIGESLRLSRVPVGRSGLAEGGAGAARFEDSRAQQPSADVRPGLPEAGSIEYAGDSDPGWVVHVEDDGVSRSFWISAARVDFWLDVPSGQAGRDAGMGWTLLGEEWVKVLGGRKGEPGLAAVSPDPVRGVALRFSAVGGSLGCLVYTNSVEWLVSRERARLQGLEKLDDWVWRRASSLRSKGSITPKEDSVETHFDVGNAQGKRSRAA